MWGGGLCGVAGHAAPACFDFASETPLVPACEPDKPNDDALAALKCLGMMIVMVMMVAVVVVRDDGSGGGDDDDFSFSCRVGCSLWGSRARASLLGSVPRPQLCTGLACAFSMRAKTVSCFV